MKPLGIVFIILGVLNLLNAVWMITSAATWYELLPAGVPDFGPYNGHFIRDIGLVYGISGVGFVWSAFHLRDCRPVLVAQAIWAGGHALLHVAELLSGRIEPVHGLLDAPGVFLPGIVLGILVLTPVWKVVNPQDRPIKRTTRMPQLIAKPTEVPAAGNKQKHIREYVGRVNSSTDEVSIAHMISPGGWIEPGQRPEFTEYTIVLRGLLRVEHELGDPIDVRAGQAIITMPGEWVRYSTPTEDGAEYIAVCTPAFCTSTVYRDSD